MSTPDKPIKAKAAVSALERELSSVNATLEAAQSHKTLLQSQYERSNLLQTTRDLLATACADLCAAKSNAASADNAVEQAKNHRDSLRFSLTRLAAISGDNLDLGGAAAWLISYDEAIEALGFFIDTSADKIASLRDYEKASAARVKAAEATKALHESELARINADLEKIENSANAESTWTVSK